MKRISLVLLLILNISIAKSQTINYRATKTIISVNDSVIQEIDSNVKLKLGTTSIVVKTKDSVSVYPVVNIHLSSDYTQVHFCIKREGDEFAVEYIYDKLLEKIYLHDKTKNMIVEYEYGGNIHSFLFMFRYIHRRWN